MRDKVTRCSTAYGLRKTRWRRLALYCNGIYAFEPPVQRSVVVATGDEIKLREARHRVDTENNAPRGRYFRHNSHLRG